MKGFGKGNKWERAHLDQKLDRVTSMLLNRAENTQHMEIQPFEVSTG